MVGRTLAVYHSLPFRCSLDSQSPTPSLIQDNVDTKPDTPRRRRRRRSRSNLEFSFSSLATQLGAVSLEASGGNGNGGEEKRGELKIRPVSQHPCSRIPTGNPDEQIVYVGLMGVEDETALHTLRDEFDCLPVTVDKETADRFERYCNEVMTELFHYRLFEQKRLDIELMKGWEDLVKVSQRFAELIQEEFEEGDRVLVMDHRLVLLPRMLQDVARGRIPVVFHLGVPFPSSEIIRCHPQAREIMTGFLGSDVIVFQVYSYIRHFMSSCTRILGLESTPRAVDYNGLPIQLRVVPVGVDTASIAARLEEPRTVAKLESIRKVFRGQRIMLAIDGLETRKGIMHTMQAYEHLLEAEPKWIGEVITSNRQDKNIMDIAGRINNRFGYLGFHPVQLFHQAELDPSEYIALLTLADVFLVISERAAFSIPALEYIACQNKRYGQLVISEFVGNAIFLPSIFLVNPWDHSELAMVMQDALTVPLDDMILRHEERSRVVSKFGVHWWHSMLLQELDEAHSLVVQHLITPALDTREVYRRYLMGTKRIFLLDYDGTLIGIKSTPREATPSPELIRSLRTLCQDPSNLVYVISGRDRKWLEQALGRIERLGLSAEHGCYLLPVPVAADAPPQWDMLVREEELTWRQSVVELMNYYTERTPGSLMEHKSASITWHYRLADTEFGQRQAHELQSLLEQTVVPNHAVGVLAGKKNIEVRPLAASKGNIARDLLRRHAGADFVLCIGDDRTDEDMFRVFLEDRLVETDGFFTCKVGLSQVATSAVYGMRGVDQVNALLSRLSMASTERMNIHPTV